MLSLLCVLQMMLPVQNEHVRITVSMEDPTHHYYQIEMMFPARNMTRREIMMPAWTPGSYKIRDFARHVEAFTALDLNNTPLPWEKKDKATWEIQTNANQPFKVLYRVFSRDFTVRTNYLDSFYGFLNPGSTFFYEKDRMRFPHRIRVVTPEKWIAAVPLPKQGSQTYLADDWHQLVDSPMVFGPLRIHEFQVNDIVHRWVIAGEPNIDEDATIDAFKKIGESAGAMFGGYPFNRYFFLTVFKPGNARGGLEHRNNTLVIYGADNLRDQKGWDGFLGLMIHEYFHAWNVMSIRDQVLMNLDYQDETYTKLLWVHEGWTSYYDQQLMARAGFWKPKRLLKAWADDIANYLKTPGVNEQSLVDASFNAWIHYYQRTEASNNAQVSYYSVGALAALSLDLMIRQQTRNSVSLDDVLVKLDRDYAAKGEGITIPIIMDVLEEMVGFAASKFILDYVMKPQPLPLEQTLGYAGIIFDTSNDEKKEKTFETNPKVSMGITTRSDGDRVFVNQVRRDSNGWEAGLDFDDEILAINQRRVTKSNYEKILSWSYPGDEVQVLISRSGTVKNIAVRLQAKPNKLSLKRVEAPTKLQEEIYQAVFNPLGIEEKAENKKAE